MRKILYFGGITNEEIKEIKEKIKARFASSREFWPQRRIFALDARRPQVLKY